MTRPRRRTTAAVAVAVLGVLLAGAVTAVVSVVAPAPAQASSYRYWTYWWGAGTGSNSGSSWRFAPQGPASHPVADGWVLGWRFATTSAAGGAAPRSSASFASLCPTLAPQDGKVRVALVLDYGTTADAPPGQKPPTTSSVRRECLLVPKSGSTGVTVLSAAGVEVSTKNGLICSLDSYPRDECAPVIADPTPSASSARPTRTPTPTPTPSSSRTGASSPSTAATGASTSPLAGLTISALPSATQSASRGTLPADPPSASDVASLPVESPLPLSSGAPVSATAVDGGSGSPLPLVLGGVVVAGLGLAAWRTSRSRGGTP